MFSMISPFNILPTYISIFAFILPFSLALLPPYLPPSLIYQSPNSCKHKISGLHGLSERIQLVSKHCQKKRFTWLQYWHVIEHILEKLYFWDILSNFFSPNLFLNFNHWATHKIMHFSFPEIEVYLPKTKFYSFLNKFAILWYYSLG